MDFQIVLIIKYGNKEAEICITYFVEQFLVHAVKISKTESR